MRRAFADLLYEEMAARPVAVIAADLGYGMWDRVRGRYPDRFFNVGAAEQCMIGLAVGLARGGMVSVCYSITPFLLYRSFELIRQYLSHEGVPVILVGSGRDRDYAHDGFTHWAEDDRTIMACLAGIDCLWPESIEDMRAALPDLLYSGRPAYLNLRR